MTSSVLPAAPRPGAAAAVISAYEPGPNLPALVRSLTDDGVAVVVVDDASTTPAGLAMLSASEDAGAAVLRKERNTGIGDSLARGAATALDAGYSYILTLDQDSGVAAGYTARAIEHLGELEALGHRAGLVVPARNSGELVRGLSAPGADGAVTCLLPIQSGGVYPDAALRDVGAFRADFVMDAVDHDYALRLRRAGWGVFAVMDLDLDHELGEPQVRRVLGRSVMTTNHSRLRKYYQFRNRLVLVREHWRTDREGTRELLKGHVRETVRVVGFEQHRLRKAAILARASWHGVLGRTGHVDPQSFRRVQR